MRFVDRAAVPEPASLAQNNSQAADELIGARLHYIPAGEAPGYKPDKAYDFAAYKRPDVIAGLERLFHRKCAYCESSYGDTQPVDVEHYRPKGGVQESAGHPGYWWLAMRWDNLLPSCIDCNRRRRQTTATPGMTLEALETSFLAKGDEPSGKQNAFPTENANWVTPETDPEGVEQPLLIDPTRIDPADHLTWSNNGPVSVMIPISVNAQESRRGVASIHVYGLNRTGLVQARTERLKILKYHAIQVHKFLARASDMNRTEAQREEAVMDAESELNQLISLSQDARPYSAMAKLFLNDLKRELEALSDNEGAL